MARIPFERIWAAIDRLSDRQQAMPRRELVRTAAERLVLDVLNGPECRPAACPHCLGPRLQRWGLAGGLQRYRCRDCHRTCNPLTGTPLARLRRRDLWLDHAGALCQGASLRTAARRLGVHHHTTFRWRHRWLAWPARRQAPTLRGTVAVDAVPFHERGAGWSTGRRVAIEVGPLSPPASREDSRQAARPPLVQALILRDGAAGRVDALLPGLEGATIAAVLEPLVAGGSTLLSSDDAPAFAAAARAIGLRHRPCRSQPDDPQSGDLATLRGYSDRLAAWMQRFSGVSTRYLTHYLGWRRLLEQGAPGHDPLSWLRLAVARPPTANVGRLAHGPGDGGRMAAGPGAVASPAR